MKMMIQQQLLSLVLCLLQLSCMVSAEMYTLYNLGKNNGKDAYVEDGQGIRYLQGSEGTSSTGTIGSPNLETGNLGSINATVDTCRTTAFNTVCRINTAIQPGPQNQDQNPVALQAVVTCALDSQVAFDFRRASNCGCTVTVNGQVKNCTCATCPFDFGNSPISIFCQDEFIIGECTSLDCSFACNGTCNFGCGEGAGEECSFCEDNVFAPTAAPAGTGNNPNQGSTIDSGAVTSVYRMQVLVTMSAILAMAFYVLV